MAGVAQGTGRVLWPQPPVDGESLLGWIARTAHENVLPSAYTILRRSGLSYTDKPIAALTKAEAAPLLASALGTDQAAVDARMLTPHPVAAFVELGGVLVRRSSLVTHIRRFSPSTLRDTGTHLASWMFRFLPLCHRSWEFLQDSCADCGQVQRWRNAQDQRRCDTCNADLTRQDAELVDMGLRHDLSELASLAHGTGSDRRRIADSLPAELKTLSAGGLLDVTSLVAGIVDPDLPFGFSSRVVLDEQRQVASAYAEAWRLVRAIPESLHQLASSLVTSSANPRSRAIRARIRSILDGKARNRLVPEVQLIIDTLQASDALNLEKQGDADLRVKPAAWILGATEGEVAAAREAGILKKRLGFRHGALRTSLDRNEVEYLGEVRTNRLAARSIAFELGLPKYAGDQLLASAVVRRHDHPWLLARYGAPQSTHSDLTAFRAKLKDLQSKEDFEVSIPLGSLMKRIGGGPKPWDVVFRMMMERQLPYRLEDDRITPRSIMIPASHAHRVSCLGNATWQDGYTWEDAMDILNLSRKHQEALASINGTREKGQGWRLDAGDLRQKASTYISMGELVARTDKAAPTVAKLVREKGLGPSGLFGWDRKRTEAELSAFLL